MSSSAARATLRVSPRKKNKALPAVPGRHATATPIAAGSSSSNAPPEEDAAVNEFGHGAFAGPSSPTRRRRRPSATRRRSSSITAAAALISSYSTSPNERTRGNSAADAYDSHSDDDDANARAVPSRQPIRRTSLKRSTTGRRRASADDNDDDDDDDDEDGFGDDAGELVHDARKALSRGRASPYHMALVTLLFSLAQGMPLASQFKVYSYMMCQVFQQTHDGKDDLHAATLPPAPELPSSPVCDNVWVQNATSTYAAAMATVGALVSLVLLSRCTRLSEYFGRKPLLLGTHVLLGLATVVFRLSVLLPTYVGVAVLYIAVMVLEASAGAPLRIAYQNYVVDTTTEAQRAGALSFVDGFGQIGAFPSSTLGGWLAVVTQRFFAPFYASMAVYTFATAYVLVFVPESKKHRHHTVIDDFERFGESEPGAGKPNNEDDDDTDGDTDGGIGTESHFSSIDSGSAAGAHSQRSRLQQLLHKVNFLEPLSVFLPRRRSSGADGEAKWTARSLRLFTLAVIVVLEESFQVFLVPVLLLYNSSVFDFDVVQNGYLVSLLQGVRAAYLTVCFPWAVSKMRGCVQRRKRASSAANGDDEATERTPLVRNTSQQDDGSSKSEERGRLDVAIMFFSYVLSAASFGLLATTRTWSDKKTAAPPWVGVAIAIVGIQLGAGATSLRTALLVNAVSEMEDDREERRLRQQLRQSQSAAADGAARRPSLAAGATPSKADVRIHHERHQSKALAANQILCTAVYAFVPLLTSRIFGAGLQSHRPELVWVFKAAVAGLSALVTLILFLSQS